MSVHYCYRCMEEFEAETPDVKPDEVRQAACPRCSLGCMALYSLRNHILRDARQYFIHKVKAPFRLALILYSERFPKVTRENKEASQRTVRNLLDLEEWFMEHDVNPTRRVMFTAAWRIILAVVATDPYYEFRLIKILRKAMEMDWDEVLWIDGNWAEIKNDLITQNVR